MKGRLFHGLALSLAFAASSYGGLREAVMPRTANQSIITIRVHNYAQVKSSVLLPATKAASEILREAGVDTVWVECPVGQPLLLGSVCANPVTPLDLVVNLLPRSTQDLHCQGGILGAAKEGTGRNFGFLASVFYDNLTVYSAQRALGLSPLLGHVIAHELGHLLLGSNSHSANGIMRARWRGEELLAAEQGGLSFSFCEKKRLQIAMAARTLAALSVDERAENFPDDWWFGKGE